MDVFNRLWCLATGSMQNKVGCSESSMTSNQNFPLDLAQNCTFYFYCLSMFILDIIFISLNLHFGMFENAWISIQDIVVVNYDNQTVLVMLVIVTVKSSGYQWVSEWTQIKYHSENSSGTVLCALNVSGRFVTWAR